MSTTSFVWQPTLGAIPDAAGTLFRVYAPKAQHIAVRIESPEHPPQTKRLEPEGDGYFAQYLAGVGAGVKYWYQLNHRGLFPDPVSRFQPEGVHGPSQVVDPTAYQWSDVNWRGVASHDLVIYELHLGTVTSDGTWRALVEKLPYLCDLGVTAIEVMPVADFPGQRNWGYDGVALFAPARCYGPPDDMRRFVDLAHQCGLAVLLDVVYNHLGPDGNYLGNYTDHFFATHHRTPWGSAVNVDGEHSQHVRRMLVENAMHWMHEYHLDGLRFDATPAIIDRSPQHIVSEIAQRIRESVPHRVTHMIAEDDRNDVAIVRSSEVGGWGLDGIWSDDFHHQMRRLLAHDNIGYYRDYGLHLDDLVTIIQQGWLFSGEHSVYRSACRGTKPTGMVPSHFINYLQNHDQIGNRPLGDRLHHELEPAVYRAASLLFLLAPQTPMLFMGQEWAASSPFQFFTDHHDELGKLVDIGRRREYAAFCGYEDPTILNAMPNPQAERTFTQSKLRWEELDFAEHAAVLGLYRAALRLRKSLPRTDHLVRRFGQVIGIRYSRGLEVWWVLVTFEPTNATLNHDDFLQHGRAYEWEPILLTDENGPGNDPPSIRWEWPKLMFEHAGGVVLQGQPTDM